MRKLKSYVLHLLAAMSAIAVVLLLVSWMEVGVCLDSAHPGFHITETRNRIVLRRIT